MEEVFISGKHSKTYKNAIKRLKCMASFTFSKPSSGPDWSLKWADSGHRALCLTPMYKGLGQKKQKSQWASPSGSSSSHLAPGALFLFGSID